MVRNSKSKGRRTFEYVTAGVITGMMVPSIYNGYKSTFNTINRRVSITLEDVMGMVGYSEDDFEEFDDDEE